LEDLAKAGTPSAKTVIMLARDDAEMDTNEEDDVSANLPPPPLSFTLTLSLYLSSSLLIYLSLLRYI
jgi:hypothetical protein